MPENVKEHSSYNHAPSNGNIELMETIFAQREAALWSQAVAWTFMMDCMKDFLENFDPQSFAEAQNELVESYEGLEEFFDGLNEMADITDNLFTVNPTST